MLLKRCRLVCEGGAGITGSECIGFTIPAPFIVAIVCVLNHNVSVTERAILALVLVTVIILVIVLVLVLIRVQHGSCV
tara:strand:- start:510 stop:743 length:234 start_codon:yes stop_codon:yes gene_type:complete